MVAELLEEEVVETKAAVEEAIEQNGQNWHQGRRRKKKKKSVE